MNDFKIKRRIDLENLNKSICDWLRSHDPVLFDKYLPSSKKQYSKEYILNSLDSYSYMSDWNKEQNALRQYAKRRGWLEEIKEVFSYKLKKNCLADAIKYETKQDWKEGSRLYFVADKKGWLKECSFHMISREGKKCLENIPSDIVRIAPGQKWEGVRKEYYFICNKFGLFKKTYKFAKKSWQRGLSGHPKYGRESIAKKTKKRLSIPVKNLNTGEVFGSSAEAAKTIGLTPKTVGRSIQKRHKCKGYHWAYCDENGNIID